MKEPTASITVQVDPTNPGQFFACCGLLELADRLWPGAEGWFEKPWFCIASLGTLSDLISRLAQAKIRSSLSGSQLERLGTLLSAKKAKLTPEDVEEKQRLSEMWKRERLHLSAPFDLWLDWWRDERGERTALKTWAAKQLVAKMASGMLQTLQKVEWSEGTCLAGPAWKKPRFFHLLGRYLAQMIIKVLSPAQVQLANSQGISSTQLVQYTCTNALRR
jgi:CRISPR-associated protein Csb3